jgi:cytochrome oxidase assembly protein ShyY1
MQRLERSQIVALTVALLLLVPISGLAARWQWNRYEERDARNLLISTNANAQPVDAEQLLIAGSKPKPEDEWTVVKLTGVYQSAEQKLWRRQPLNGAPGFIAITPLVTDSGLRVLVQRGWVAALGRDPVPDADLTIEPGTHTVTGRIRFIAAGDSVDPSDLPAGVTNSPMTMLDASTPLVTVEMTDDDRDFALALIPLPEITSGPHLGYVGQWILIGIGTISVYIIVLRRSREQTLLERQQSQETSV